mmetsp:Transcript_4209/g.10264  ORF Transcript_4209/g.10264 Transcript_4209/m.10264 type:complete len:229 (+) Transcript_4209:182-868(+)
MRPSEDFIRTGLVVSDRASTVYRALGTSKDLTPRASLVTLEAWSLVAEMYHRDGLVETSQLWCPPRCARRSLCTSRRILRRWLAVMRGCSSSLLPPGCDLGGLPAEPHVGAGALASSWSSSSAGGVTVASVRGVEHVDRERRRRCRLPSLCPSFGDESTQCRSWPANGCSETLTSGMSSGARPMPLRRTLSRLVADTSLREMAVWAACCAVRARSSSSRNREVKRETC